jgi:peptide/nickel transport system substrate-binding protein
MLTSALSKRVLLLGVLAASLMTGCTSGQLPPPQTTLSQTPPPQTSSPQTGSPAETQAAPREGGELVAAALGKLPSFDPFGGSKQETALTDFESLVYRGLFTHGPDRSLAPALASGYTIDRTQSKPAVVVTLRKGVVWSDGQPVTVDDVVYTYEEYANPHYYGVWRKWSHLLDGVSPFRAGKAPHIAGITADPKKGTVRFALVRNDVTFLQSLTAPLLPKHQLAGKPIGELDALSRSGKMVGAGPFQVKALEEGAWQFAANSHYYEGKPHLEAVRVVPIPPAQLADEVKAGRIHFSWVSPEMAHRLAAAGGEAWIASGAANGYHFLGFNTQSPGLQDVEVRRALAQAVSPQTIAKESFWGLAAVVKSPLAPGSFAYAPGEMPGYQPEAAASALARKGYTQEKPLVLTLTYPGGNPVRERLVDSLLKAWSSLPVRIEKKALPAEEFAAAVFGGSKLDLYLYAWKYPNDPAELMQLYHSREKVGELGLNASRYQNRQADQLLERGQLLLPAEERKKLFAAWQQRFAADLPIFPLLALPNRYVVSNRLHGVPQQLETQPFAEIHTWWVE